MTESSGVEAANTALYTAVEAGDLDLMNSVWLDGPGSESLVCVHPGWPPLRGRSQILRSWAAVMAATPYIQFFLTDVDIRVLGETALVTCTENVLTGIDDEEGAPSGFSGAKVAATNVFRRTSSGWRLLVHHASPVLAPPAPGEPDGTEEEDAT